MALSAEVQRKVFLYFGITQATVARGIGPFSVPVVNQLQTALDNLTAAGETNVTQLVATLDGKWADLEAVSDSLQVRKAGAIELRGDEFDARREAFNFFLARLDALLFLPSQSLLKASGANGGGFQGPDCEP